MQGGTPVPPWGYRCVPSLRRQLFFFCLFSIRKINLHDCVCQSKHKTRAQITVQNKNMFEKCFWKVSSIHKKARWSIHANIKSSDSYASHHSQRQNNLYKNITLGKQNSIASLHSSKMSVSTVVLHPKGANGVYKEMLSTDLPPLPKGHCSQKVSGVSLQLYEHFQFWERCYR